MSDLLRVDLVVFDMRTHQPNAPMTANGSLPTGVDQRIRDPLPKAPSPDALVFGNMD
ncbi:MAG: hypothetical protein FWD68_09280 [Alphaproteobacteria bacterium]|nr:hypothetical protein [Alphaproteobacteria bacterium]